MTQGIPPSAPPSRRRGNRNPSPQEYAPVNVIMALIGQSRRRCVTITEMLQKQGAGLVQLHMECQQMAGLIRNDPQSLNRLGISLNAARSTLEKNKQALEEQIQAELFLQGEFQRWLNGEPPTDFAPPPPGMVRHENAPPALGYAVPAQLPQRAQQPGMTRDGVPPTMQHQGPQHQGPPGQPRMRSPMPQQPRMVPPSAMPMQRSPQYDHHSAVPGARLMTPAGNDGGAVSYQLPMPPQAAYAAYRLRPMPVPQQQLPVVRFPVEQYAPPPQEQEAADDAALAADDDRETGNHHETPPPRLPVNGPSAPAMPAEDENNDDKSTASPS